MNRDAIERTVDEVGVLQAGRSLFESVPFEQRPRWAAGVLRACRFSIEAAPGVVLEAEQLALGAASDWNRGHVVFGRLRKTTMVLDAKKWKGPGLTPGEDRLHQVVLVAELVAKVVYNATGAVDSFDDDSGWNLLPSALRLVGSVSDSNLEGHVWNALVDV